MAEVRSRVFRRAQGRRSAACAATPDDKNLILIRHGETEMNSYLHKNPYMGNGFKDPGFYDTILNQNGIAQAKALNDKLRRQLLTESGCEVDVVMVSPLTRTLQTADFAFHGFDDTPRIVNPMIREKLWLASDVGSPPSKLSKRFPHYDFTVLDDYWWYEGECRSPLEDWQIVREEPNHKFVARLEAFRKDLMQRPESTIAVVAHWGVLNAMTGRDFRNCESYRCTLSTLRKKFRAPGES
uniref:Phosphoglycerate mutase n=1 Tax=Lotharella oceanica TaxID=641309 RepID=A0A7S2U494_9EUKA